MIEARGIAKAFRSHTVLKNASFRIGEGETVGLYGESGIGKSTVAKILCGICRPDAGEILLDGKVLVSRDVPYDRKRGITIQPVYQQPHAALDPRQKLSGAFSELVRYHGFARTRAEEQALIEKTLEEAGLDPSILSHLPHQISGGEAQRVCIAKCLLFSPRLMILDEATSMLDMSTQANVIGMVRRRMKERNGSILLISHDRALTEHLSDRIYIFENQRLKEEKDQ